MNKEDKELLLKDLSARLPFGVYADIWWNDGIVVDKCFINTTVISDLICNEIRVIKPYLRPMSSMTEEEKEEVVKFIGVTGKANIIGDIMLKYKRDYIMVSESVKLIDWLNAHHFDFRNLIDKGLAIGSTRRNV